METSTTFIISLNQLPTEFWEQHLKLDQTKLYHWRNPMHAINNLTTVWPDVIIIDAYWAKASYEIVLQQILSQKTKAKIYCLTPLAAVDGKLISINKKVSFNTFNYDVLEEINAGFSTQKEEKLIQYQIA